MLVSKTDLAYGRQLSV